MSFIKKLHCFTLATLLLLVSSSCFAEGELKGKTLTVTFEPFTAPNCFFDKDIKEPIGMDVDIVHELQRRLGFDLTENRIISNTRGGTINQLLAHHADMIGGGMSITADRAKLMDFTAAYYRTGVTLVFSTKQNPQGLSLATLGGKKVLVIAGSSNVDYAKQNLPSSELITCTNLTTALFMVAEGKADAFIYDYPPLKYYADTMPSLNLKLSDDLFDQENSTYGFALAKGSPYRDIINRELARMMFDGTVNKLQSKWKL